MSYLKLKIKLDRKPGNLYLLSMSTRLRHFDATRAAVATELVQSATCAADLNIARDACFSAGVMTLGLELNRGTLAMRKQRMIERINTALASDN